MLFRSVGALPLLGSLAVGLGVPAAIMSLAWPPVALALLLFSIPFSNWTKVTFGEFSITSTDVLVAVLLVGWIARAVPDRQLAIRGGPSLTAAIALLAAAFLSTLTAVDLPDAIKELIKLCELIGVGFFAATNLASPSAARVTVWLISAAAASEALVGLGQFVTGSGPESFAIGPFIRAYGNFEQPNALAGYLGLAFPFALIVALQRSRAQLLGLVGAIIILAAIGASLSRGAWLGIALGLVAMGLAWDRSGRRWVLPGVAAIMVILLLARAGLAPEALTARLAVFFENFWVFDVRTVDTTPANWSLVERMAHWQAGWAIAVDNPVVGIGPGNWDKVYEDYYLPGWRESLGHAHNYYLNTLVELGAIGLAIFMVFVATIDRKSTRLNSSHIQKSRMPSSA